jgi:6-phosphogluconolactonase (cycloisomerase 2 family)
MTQHELRLFSMNSEGDLRPLARQELQKGLRQILFHPSGRFLYTVDAASALQAYSIDSSGRLELLMSIDHAGSSMAITLTGPRAADR